MSNNFPPPRTNLTGQNVLNIFAPSAIKSCTVPYLELEAPAVKSTSFDDTTWFFNTFSFYCPVPVAWGYVHNIGDPAPDLESLAGDDVHLFEGGRFSTSVGQRVRALYFLPLEPPPKDILILVQTG